MSRSIIRIKANFRIYRFDAILPAVLSRRGNNLLAYLECGIDIQIRSHHADVNAINAKAKGH